MFSFQILRLGRLVKKVSKLKFAKETTKAAQKHLRKFVHKFHHLKRKREACGRDKTCLAQVRSERMAARKEIEHYCRRLREERLKVIIDQEKARLSEISSKSIKKKAQKKLKFRITKLEKLNKKRLTCK